MQIIVSARDLRACHRATDLKDMRPFCHAVLLDTMTLTAYGTNGHIMVECPLAIEDADAETPQQIWLRIDRQIPKSWKVATIDIGLRQITGGKGKPVTFSIETVTFDGFPRVSVWQNPFTPSQGVASTCFDPGILARVTEDDPIQMTFPEANGDPIRVEPVYTDNATYKVTFMPVRDK